MTYTLTDLVGAVGGYLGLFIGFSCYGMIQQLVMLSTKIGVKMIGDRKLKRASSGSETYPIFNFNKS